MKSPSNLPKSYTDTAATEDRVSIDVAIMLAVIAVLMITALIQILSLIKAFSSLIDALHEVLIIAVLGCGMLAGWRSIIAKQSKERWSVFMSATLGSLLTAIFTTASATTAVNNSSWVVFAGLLAIIALSLFCLFTLFRNVEEKTPPRPSESPTPPVPIDKTARASQKNRSAQQIVSSSTNKSSSKQSASSNTKLSPRKPTSSVADTPVRKPIQSANADTPGRKQTTPSNIDAFLPPKRVANNFIPPIFITPPDEPLLPSPAPYNTPSLNTPQSHEELPHSIAIPTEVILRQSNGLNIMPTVMPELPPLFENDQLYQLPPTGKQFFFRVKSNDIEENYEDASSISTDNTRFALCDGVSSSTFVRPWAQLLCQQWVTQPLLTIDTIALDSWLEEPRSSWQRWIQTTWYRTINEHNTKVGLPQVTREETIKLIAQGANATFLGVYLDRELSNWWACALGDTCLFHFYEETSLTWDYDVFPLKSVDDFSDAPATMTSQENATSFMTKNMKLIRRPYQTGDILLMATDALAEWLLKQLEQQRILNIIHLLNTFTDEVFAAFVDQERTQRRMKDDDTSLVIIRP